MPNLIHILTVPVELNDGLKRVHGFPVGLADKAADAFAAPLTQGGSAYTPGGSADVKGYFVRPDGQTVYLTGSKSGSTVSVTLSPACYALTGPYTLTLKVEESDDNIGTVLIVDGTVVQTQTGDVADYGDEYPSLETLLSMLDGKIDEPSTEGTSGQVLATDGEGGRYWASGAAVSAVSRLIVDGTTYTLREGSSGAAGYITIETE